MDDLIKRLQEAESGNFVCAICQCDIDMRWNRHRGPDRTIPPVCNGCEREYSRGVGKPASGSFMDRRNVVRGIALAEALRTEAARQTWGSRHV